MKKSLRITVNGKTYDVLAEILDDESASAPQPSLAAPVRAAAAVPVAASTPAPKVPSPASAAALGDVPSPLAGKVVSIAAPVGTTVTEGQVVIVLEAMKMNTEVTAPAAGTVKSVAVAPGEAVEEGQTLMTIG